MAKQESELKKIMNKKMTMYTDTAHYIILKGWEQVIKVELLKKINNVEIRKIIEELK